MADYYDPVKHIGPMVNHQRIYDFERDILRVRNPLNADFTFPYDMLPRTITANGTQDWERYLVRRYIWAIMGHIYNQITEKKMNEAVESFRRTHPDVVDDPYLLNEQIYLKLQRADDPEFQKKIIRDCVIGVVSKGGSTRLAPRRPNQGQLDPNTPLYDQLISDFKTIDPNALSQPIAPINTPPTQPLVATEPLVQPATSQEVTI